jgi:hypothetical protein
MLEKGFLLKKYHINKQLPQKSLTKIVLSDLYTFLNFNNFLLRGGKRELRQGKSPRAPPLDKTLPVKILSSFSGNLF